jgi:hypothetical protein
MRIRFTLPGVAVCLYVVCAAGLLWLRLALPHGAAFQDDAGQYHLIAKHLLEHGIYSLDGVTPFFEREPGYSVLLAGIYAAFGVGNRGAIFVVQAVMYLLASLIFHREFRRHVPERAADIALLLLLLFPASFHAAFTVLRETLSLSLMMGFATGVLALSRRCGPRAAVGGGLCLGTAAVTFVPFLLIPPFFAVLSWILKIRWRDFVLLLVAMAVPVGIWGIRNMSHTGSLCLTGCNRAALQWYVRGVQAETINGWEPITCLYAEFVTRDWTGLDENCAFNGVMHRKWPEGFKALPEDRVFGEQGIERIKRHPIAYLWLSVFEAVELHLPYVNGWGRTYNVLALAATGIVYLGFLLWFFFRCWRRTDLLFLMLIGYVSGVFGLTDATPRYLMPVIFAYMALAGIGYDLLVCKLWKR